MAVGVAVDGVALAAAAVDGDGVVGLVLGEALPAREEAGVSEHPARGPALSRVARSSGRRLTWWCAGSSGTLESGIPTPPGAVGR